jgi:L-lactate dehydrogenase complex protein LldG
MTSARDEILTRIRAASGTAAPAADVDAAYAAIARGYRRAHHDPSATDIVALFAERAADYRAVVEQVPEAELPSAIARALAAAPTPAAEPASAAEPAPPHKPEISRSMVVPGGVPDKWLAELPAEDAIVRDDPVLSARDLDKVFGVITGCAAAIAETGTIIMDHGAGQGRRALTLVPDFHLVVVRADQVEADISGALGRLDPARPHTLISGPSATSDIELIRVEGVHGPRNLHILIAR